MVNCENSVVYMYNTMNNLSDQAKADMQMLM